MKYLKTLILVSMAVSHYSYSQTKPDKPLVVFVTGDHEYSSELTMPLFAEELEKNYGFRVKVLKAFPDHDSEENIHGLEILKEADLAVFFLRWRRLSADQVQHIDDYLKSGKPVIGFRTSTHAFNYPAGHLLERWNSFGEFALGTPPGWEGKAGHVHCGHDCTTEVSVIHEAFKNPILTGVEKTFHVRSWLYKVLPDYPVKGSEWLLMGKAINPNIPTFIDNPVAWTWKNAAGGKVFTTTLGHPEDFQVESVQRLVINAVHWAVGKPIPKVMVEKISINVKYGQHAIH
jgi:type 1 glutamine amidotransferase